MGRDMGAKLWRHFRPHAKPALEARHGLMEQHAEPIDGAVPARFAPPRAAASRAGYRRCRPRSRRQASAERSMSSGGFTRHAEARGVDQEPAAGKRPVPVLPSDRRDARDRSLAPEPRPAPGCDWPAGSWTRRPRSDHAAMARAAPPAPSTITGRPPLFHSRRLVDEIAS